MSRSRRVLGPLGILALLAFGTDAAGQTVPPQPAFAETACDLPDVPPQLRPRLRCGTVAVPRRNGNPGAGSFTLAIVVVRGAEPALPDPIVYIGGGPGSPLTIHAASQARVAYAPNRDLILVDQRGTGRSEPSICPGMQNRLLEIKISAAADTPGDGPLWQKAAFTACRMEAVARGLDPDEFGTTVTAADFEWVRRALGVAKWNVYGESYGTAVAMTLMASHPETVRSAVLDSVYPPDPSPLWSAQVARAREAFFAYCAGDERCAGSFPDLRGTYRKAVERLDRSPMFLTMFPDRRMQLTPGLFELLVGNLIYYPPNYPGLPRLIQAAADGNAGVVEPAVRSVLAAAASWNLAAHAAVECRDRPQYRSALSPDASALDRMQLYDVCPNWSDLGPAPSVPTATEVPTLVLSGQFDPVSGPIRAQQLVDQLGSRARLVEFPGLGHNVRQFSPCGAAIAAAFIGDPVATLDTACAARPEPIRFLPPYAPS